MWSQRRCNELRLRMLACTARVGSHAAAHYGAAERLRAALLPWASPSRLRQLGNMGSTVNVLRTIGKLMPRSALTLGGGAAVGYYAGDPEAVGAAWGVGTAAHLAALGLTKRKARQMSERVRSGGASLIPGAPSATAAALISSQAASLPWRMEQ